ncbi:hypothetical protein M569_07042, partial [Genlisea aurea]
MRKLFRKRARDYNSDEEEEEEKVEDRRESPVLNKTEDPSEIRFSDDAEEESDREVASDDEEGAIQPGIMKFTDGIKAFRLAFKKILKKTTDNEDVLGPVMSAHKKLVAEKLAMEEAEKKVKGGLKKEKLLISERGRVKPENYLNTHEKFLLEVATKGVVKLFNAVYVAQNAQKGLNPSKAKDEKVIKRQRKEAFFSELRKKKKHRTDVNKVVAGSSNSPPAWAPLRDDFMLANRTSSKL